jgi:signal transduction histidine kinase
MGDRGYLRRLFLILLDNAIKYTGPGGRIGIEVTAANPVTVQVRDSGIGIPAEHLPYIFDRFYRVDRARSDGGAGLGLAIAKWIAGSHGARIVATSQPGEQTTMEVIFQE